MSARSRQLEHAALWAAGGVPGMIARGVARAMGHHLAASLVATGLVLAFSGAFLHAVGNWTTHEVHMLGRWAGSLFPGEPCEPVPPPKSHVRPAQARVANSTSGCTR